MSQTTTERAKEAKGNAHNFTKIALKKENGDCEAEKRVTRTEEVGGLIQKFEIEMPENGLQHSEKTDEIVRHRLNLKRGIYAEDTEGE